MILTVTPNAAVDTTYTVPGFALDRVNRPTEQSVVAGGKGINVARVYRELGGNATATGFIAGHNGQFILSGLRAERIPHDFVETGGESRICIAILDPETQTQTELNEWGPAVTRQDADRLKEKVASHLEGCRLLVLSGSMPPGCPESLYAELIEEARERSVPAILDSSGEALRLGLRTRPFMVKPNCHELGGILGNPIRSVEAAAEAARWVIGKGVEIVAVSMGKEGVLVSDTENIWYARPPEVPFVSAVGSGDAMAAGFAFGLLQGWPMERTIRLATCCGAANVAVPGAGACKRPQIEALLEKVEIHYFC
ncbi:MAG: 1-phosphofructokinase [Armatimonadetes bacterium]|nr:1-phosphofructokinase [Armatimonadota bacterium]